MIYSCQDESEFVNVLNTAIGGDIICLQQKEYFFSETINITQSKITIIGYGAILDFRKIPYVSDNYCGEKSEYYKKHGDGINIYGNHNFISQLSVKYAPFCGICNYGNYNTFDNIETCYNCDSGFSQKGCCNILKNCISHHNCDYRLIIDGEQKCGFNSDGFSDKLYEGPGNMYIQCNSYCNGDDGFDFFQRETSKNNPTIIINCKSYKNGGTIDLSDNMRIKEDSEFALNNIYVSQGNGKGFKLGGTHKKTLKENPHYINEHHIMMYDSEAYLNKEKGFSKNGNKGQIIINNCRSYKNGQKDFLTKK